MSIRKKILQTLPPPNYRAQLIAGWQNTNDIVKAIQKQHNENLSAANQIKQFFCGKDERTTARNIFDFLKYEIEYRVEPAEKQTTKSLQRFVADGFGDCKHFAIFANTVLQQCGFNPIYRFAGYRDRRNVQHVYTYLPKTNTVLDAVLPSFDTEKTPTIKKDYNMSLYKLSGVDDEIGKISFDSIKNNIKKAAAKTSSAVKKAAAEIPNAAQKLAQGAKTVSLSIPRGAFRGLVALNVNGLATNLKKLTDKKGTMDGLKWWYDLGGDRTELMNTINANANKKRIFGVNEESAAAREIYDGYSGDGVRVGEPVTIAASLATAAPILIKVVDELKKAGINVDDVAKIADVTKKAASDFQNLTGSKLTDVIFKKDAGVQTEKKNLSSNDLKPTTTADATKVVTAAVAQSTGVDSQTIKEIQQSAEGVKPFDFVQPKDVPLDPKNFLPAFNKKTLLIGGGIVLVALLAFKKR
jgi:hypothetical protein